MILILLSDIDGLGKQHEIVQVSDERALDDLLPRRLALVATPSVRKRFAKLIRSGTAR